MKTKVISHAISKGRQDVLLTAILAVDEPGCLERLRITIRSDSYEQQCYARIHRWDGDQWQLLHYLQDRNTPNSLAYRRNDDGIHPRHFEDDYNELLRVAEAVLR